MSAGVSAWGAERVSKQKNANTMLNINKFVTGVAVGVTTLLVFEFVIKPSLVPEDKGWF